MSHKSGYALGVLSVGIFIICMGWGALMATQALKDLHIQLMQVFYPGFDFSVGGVVTGLIEAFVYGWLIGIVYAWLCCKVFAKPSGHAAQNCCQ